MRHRQAAARAGGRQRPGRRDAPSSATCGRTSARRCPKRGGARLPRSTRSACRRCCTTALEALYGNYCEHFEAHRKAGISIPPCFIVVCNNTSTSKLAYDFISGFHRENADGSTTLVQGRLELFRNFDEHGNPYPRPRTLLIDSEQLESGDALDKNFRSMAAEEIDRFRREIVERTGDRHAAEKVSDQALLREVMNTVGKEKRLGESIRCVVSGVDAHRRMGREHRQPRVGRARFRHAVALRAGGRPRAAPPLLRSQRGRPVRCRVRRCLGRPLRLYGGTRGRAAEAAAGGRPRACRESRKRRARDQFSAGGRIPRGIARREAQREIQRGLGAGAHARPDRSVDHHEPGDHRRGRQPRSGAYQRPAALDAAISPDPTAALHKWRDPGDEPELYLFTELKRITRQWLDNCLVCKGDTYPAQLMYQELADMACERIAAAIVRGENRCSPVKAVLDPYNPLGSTAHVNFHTSRADRWKTDSPALPCQLGHLRQRLGSGVLPRGRSPSPRQGVRQEPQSRFGCPHTRYGSEARTYVPDFIVLVDDGRGGEDLLHLVVEIKGYRRERTPKRRNRRWRPIGFPA